MDQNLTLCVPRPSSGLDPHSPVLVTSSADVKLQPNQILIRVDRFGFSANNITYQALGEAPHFRYFEFHAPPTSEKVSPKTHGLIPVWGFATVVASAHPKVKTGERLYGYLAPAKYLVLSISDTDINMYFLYVPRPHLPADRRPYNQPIRCENDAQYNPALEDLTMLYRPLFWTSFWCEDWLFSSKYRGGCTRILISSASSKTAFCLAYLIRKRRMAGLAPGVRVVGLASSRNLNFTKRLGLYDDVAEYDGLTQAPVLEPAGERWIYLDVTGNAALNDRIFAYLVPSGALVASIVLGMSNLSPSAPDASSSKWTLNTSLTAPPNGAAATSDPTALETFFMVEWLALRRKQVPIAELSIMLNTAWRELMRDCRGWVQLERVCGGEAVKSAYEDLSKNGLGPEKGFIWSLWSDHEHADTRGGRADARL